MKTATPVKRTTIIQAAPLRMEVAVIPSTIRMTQTGMTTRMMTMMTLTITTMISTMMAMTINLLEQFKTTCPS